MEKNAHASTEFSSFPCHSDSPLSLSGAFMIPLEVLHLAHFIYAVNLGELGGGSGEVFGLQNSDSSACIRPCSGRWRDCSADIIIHKPASGFAAACSERGPRTQSWTHRRRRFQAVEQFVNNIV